MAFDPRQVAPFRYKNEPGSTVLGFGGAAAVATEANLDQIENRVNVAAVEVNYGMTQWKYSNGVILTAGQALVRATTIAPDAVASSFSWTLDPSTTSLVLGDIDWNTSNGAVAAAIGPDGTVVPASFTPNAGFPNRFDISFTPPVGAAAQQYTFSSVQIGSGVLNTVGI